MNTWDIKHTCTFTGHRPERLELPEERVKEWLEEQIVRAADEGYTDFIDQNPTHRPEAGLIDQNPTHRP